MATLLISHQFNAANGARVATAAARASVRAELITHTAITALLMLARGFPHRNRELRECDQDSRAQAAMSALRANHGKEA